MVRGLGCFLVFFRVFVFGVLGVDTFVYLIIY